MLFQDCDLAAKDRDLIENLVEAVASRCDCDFSKDHITSRVFQCFPSSPQTVTYHGQVHRVQDTSVTELISDIQEWVSTGVSIPVQFLPVSISEFCQTSSSTPVEQCPGDTMPSALPPSVMTMSPVEATTIAVAASVVGVLVVLLLVSVLVVSMILLRRKCHPHPTVKDSRLVYVL